MNALSITKALRSFVFIILSLFFMTNSNAEPNSSDFNLGNKQYRCINGKWYNYLNGKQGDQIVSNRVIVRLINSDRSIDQKLSELKLSNFKIDPRKLIGGYYIIEIDTARNPFNFVTKLKESLLFEYIEFDAIGKLCSTPDDLYYSNQWGLSKISIPKAWNITTGSPSIIVGVIDNGIDYTHEDLDENIWVNSGEDCNNNGKPDFSPIADGGDLDSIDNDENGYIDDLFGWNFSTNENCPYDSNASHGTAVAGIVAAQTNNDTGICGIAGGWNTQNGTKIMSLEYNTNGYNMDVLSSSVASSIKYAIENGAKIINISSSWIGTYDVLEAAIDTAVDYCNCVIVCSAGNNGGESYEPNCTGVRYPARYNKTIAVGAINQDDERWCSAGHDGSAYDWTLDIVAPAESSGTYSTFSGAIYSNSFGKTSAAAPHVTGVVALIRSLKPSLSWSTVKTIINSTAIKIDGYIPHPEFQKNEEIGYGRVNAYKALKYTVENYGATLTQTIIVPSGDTLHFKLTSDIDLNSYAIKSTGGVLLIDSGVSISPDIRLMNGSNIKGFYSTIDSAISNAGSGDVIEIRDDYSITNSITIGSGKTLKFASGKQLIVNSGGNLIRKRKI